MQITVLQENLQQALQDVAKSVSSKPSLPILSCILLTATQQQIQVSATDLNLGIRSSIQGQVTQEGKVAVPARTFSDFVSTLEPGQVELVFEGNTLKIQAGKSKASIQCFAADDYPVFPQKEGQSVSLAVETFLPVFQQTVIAASLDETRPVLTSLLFNFAQQMEVVATDGFRLATFTLDQGVIEMSETLKLLVPAKAVQEVIRIASKKKAQTIVFTISQRLKQLFFVIDGVERFYPSLLGQKLFLTEPSLRKK
jgi:DNA polymerase-3 subunit beta